MPISLSNDFAMFQRFFHFVLRGMDFRVPYLYDVLVAYDDEDQHLHHFKQMFQPFKEFGEVLNASKSAPGETSVTFLGHIVTAEGISPIPDKVANQRL
ncbi:retrovirus-related Pol polyprotein from transposon 297 [Nephila pilipes]|uniref:Retrovirus-related Pol polyprotein from transposon 297 n=1 Tax=Nephila pilipes TaxID=299642 RepID=A0A8X6TY97_NEPPI|nr:retrovirus-related Pol polyprotein from transposon 297 [Nephila pilipes]